MVIYKYTNIKVEILRKINESAYVIKFGNTITSCFEYELIWLN